MLETEEETQARIERESATAMKAIQARNKNLERSYAAGDADSVVTVFAEDARQMPPNGPGVVGRDAMLEFWTQAMSWGQWNFTLDAQTVVANGPLAIEYGRYTQNFTPGPDAPNGVTAIAATGNYLVHWRKRGQEWFIVTDIANSDESLPTVANR